MANTYYQDMMRQMLQQQMAPLAQQQQQGWRAPLGAGLQGIGNAMIQANLQGGDFATSLAAGMGGFGQGLKDYEQRERDRRAEMFQLARQGMDMEQGAERVQIAREGQALAERKHELDVSKFDYEREFDKATQQNQAAFAASLQERYPQLRGLPVAETIAAGKQIIVAESKGPSEIAELTKAFLMSQGGYLPEPPEGQTWAMGPDGRPLMEEVEPGVFSPRLINVPGSEAEAKALETQQEAAQAEQAAETARITAQSNAQAVQNAINDIYKARESSLFGDLWVTGFFGDFLRNIGGTEARNIAASLDTIKARLGFDQLQAMRDASPTGGALGQVSQLELQRLEAALASLDQAQGPDQFFNNLSEVEAVMKDVIHGAGNWRDWDSMTEDELLSINPAVLTEEAEEKYYETAERFWGD